MKLIILLALLSLSILTIGCITVEERNTNMCLDMCFNYKHGCNRTWYDDNKLKECYIPIGDVKLDCFNECSPKLEKKWKQ